MANDQINRLLEFANMQIAAEAFLLQAEDGGVLPGGDVIKSRLELGNTHASKFTPVQAEQFTAQYEIVTQYRNDPLAAGGTGFSGTLFKDRSTGELTLSFRSTEFIDDAVRDSKATNALEVKDDRPVAPRNGEAPDMQITLILAAGHAIELAQG